MNSPSLRDLQISFCRAIESCEFLLSGQELTQGKPDFLIQVKNGGPLDPAQRLHVYAYGFYKRSYRCMLQDFETTARFLGRSHFFALVHRYLHSYPPGRFNISVIGENFATFLSSHTVLEDFPFLADLARLEWLMVQSSYSQTLIPKVCDYSQIPQHQWLRLKVILNPSLFLMSSQFPLAEIWGGRALKKHCHFFQVHLESGEASFEEISEIQYQVLSCMQRDPSFSQICSELAAYQEQIRQEIPLMEWVSDWIAGGIISEIQFESQCS